MFQVALVGIAGGHIEHGELNAPHLYFHIALLCNFYSVFNRLGNIPKQRAHLLTAFEVELLRFQQAAFIQRAPHLQAHEDFLRPGIFLMNIVGIVGSHQPNAQFPAHGNEQRVYPLLLGKAMILNLKVEIPAEYLL